LGKYLLFITPFVWHDLCLFCGIGMMHVSKISALLHNYSQKKQENEEGYLTIKNK
jgi:uncharacterized membrane protein